MTLVNDYDRSERPEPAARQLAAAINQDTAGMSAAGLTAAPSGLLVPGGTVQR